MVKLANRIQNLRMQQDDGEDKDDLPESPGQAAASAVGGEAPLTGARRLSRAARSAIFREVVLAKVREMKSNQEAERTTSELSNKQ